MARVGRIRYREPGQEIGLKALGLGEVVADIVGVLFGEPDGIVRCYLHAHEAEASLWRCDLLKCVRVGVKDGEGVVTHLAKPDTSFVVDGGPHHLGIGLRQWIFTKISYSHYG